MYFDYHFGLFGELYQLIDKFLYQGAIYEYINGNLPDLLSSQFASMDLVATLFATLGSLFIIIIPFIVVIMVIKAIFKW